MTVFFLFLFLFSSFFRANSYPSRAFDEQSTFRWTPPEHGRWGGGWPGPFTWSECLNGRSCSRRRIILLLRNELEIRLLRYSGTVSFRNHIIVIVVNIVIIFNTHVRRVPVKPNVCSMSLRIEIRKSRARRPTKQRRFVRVCSSVCLSDKKKKILFFLWFNKIDDLT